MDFLKDFSHKLFRQTKWIHKRGLKIKIIQRQEKILGTTKRLFLKKILFRDQKNVQKREMFIYSLTKKFFRDYS